MIHLVSLRDICLKQYLSFPHPFRNTVESRVIFAQGAHILRPFKLEAHDARALSLSVAVTKYGDD